MELVFDLGDGAAAYGAVYLDQVRDAGLGVAVVAYLRAGIGDGRLDLLLDDLGRIEHEDRALRRLVRLRHLPLGMLQVHHPRADGGERRLRDDEGVPEAA